VFLEVKLSPNPFLAPSWAPPTLGGGSGMAVDATRGGGHPDQFTFGAGNRCWFFPVNSGFFVGKNVGYVYIYIPSGK